MRRKFMVTVKFDTSNPAVMRCLDVNFDTTQLSAEGTYRMLYSSMCNSRSTVASVEEGFRSWLSFWSAFKRGYEIVKIEEIV